MLFLSNYPVLKGKKGQDQFLHVQGLYAKGMPEDLNSCYEFLNKWKIHPKRGEAFVEDTLEVPLSKMLPHPCESAKNLGVVLDSSLSFRSHTDSIVKT